MKTILSIGTLLLIILLAWFFLTPKTTPTTIDPIPEITPDTPEITGDYCTDLRATHSIVSPIDHVVVEILPGDTITSPQTIKGCVYADENDDYDNWSPFEGQIGYYEILASDNSVLATGPLPVVMTTDWMADAMAGETIQFEATATFTAGIYSNGIVAIHNDNPSGDAIRDRQLAVPVNF